MPRLRNRLRNRRTPILTIRISRVKLPAKRHCRRHQKSSPMVQEPNVQTDRGIRNSHNCGRKLLSRLARWSRKPLVAYVVIAFAISFSFHELEHHTDRQLARAVYTNCLRSNAVRQQINDQLVALEAEIKPRKTRAHLLELTDCSRIPRP